jgi:hypothetical protein
MILLGGNKNPHAGVEVACISPEVNVFCGLLKMKVYNRFFSIEATVTNMFLAPAVGGLAWSVTHPARWDTTPFPFGCEDVSG